MKKSLSPVWPRHHDFWMGSDEICCPCQHAEIALVIWMVQHTCTPVSHWSLQPGAWSKSAALIITRYTTGIGCLTRSAWPIHVWRDLIGWVWSRSSLFHNACTACINIVLCRREFGWSSFVFSNQAFFFARKSYGGKGKKTCAHKVLVTML